jgi:hypothetical protein
MMLLIYTGLTQQVNSDVLNYLSLLQYLKVELKPENIYTPAKVAEVICSFLRDKDRSEFVKAILTMQITVM